MNKCREMLKFFTLVGQIKRVKRTGWILRGVKDPESVSDHMYRMAVMAMTMCDNELNKDHCIKLCLVHDMAECIVGDYAPQDNIPKEQKQHEENRAMEHLSSHLNKPNSEMLYNLFREYEEQKTPESNFVKDLDRFDMILQAQQYEQEENRPGWLQEFFDSTEGKFKTETIKTMVEALKEERELHNDVTSSPCSS